MREIVGIFGHQALEEFFQIASRRRIGIFHDDNAAAGVLNKNGDGSILDAALVDLRVNLGGDFVQALAVGAHFKLLVADVHFQARYSSWRPKKVMSDGFGSPYLSAVWRPPVP
jgi:hypothetical protein